MTGASLQRTGPALGSGRTEGEAPSAEVASGSSMASRGPPRERSGPALREGDRRFNHHLRQLRDEAGYSVDQVAEALGVSGRHLDRLDRGHFRASLHQLLICARIFGVGVDRFFEPIAGEAVGPDPAPAAMREAMIVAFRKINNPDVQRCLLAFSRTLARSNLEQAALRGSESQDRTRP